MDKVKSSKLDDTLGTVAWGALLVWWGVTELFHVLPSGTGALGVGLILLGVNAYRLLNGLPISGFTITAGILALLLGLDMGEFFSNLPFELPVFPILLIVLGVIVLTRSLTGREAKTQGA